MKNPKKNPDISRSNRFIIVLISVALLGLYVYSIGEYFIKVPSAFMSRGVRIGETETRSSGTGVTDLLTILPPGTESILLAAVDGKETRLIEINYLGEIQSETSINLDISEASQLSAYAGEDGKVILFARQRSLNRYIIDVGTKTWRRDILIDDVISFKSDGRYLVVKNSDALFGFDSIENFRSDSLVSGNVKYYDFDIEDGNFTIVSVIEKGQDKYDVLMTIGEEGFKEPNTIPILSDSSDPIYRKLHDIRADGKKVSLLFVMRDNRYGLNYITIQERDRDTGNLINTFQVLVPIQNSRYSLLESPEDSAAFLLRSKTPYGYNLASCRISGDGEATFSELTKTRAFSSESRAFRAGDWNSLVFSDFEDETRTIYYASENPELIQSASRLRTDDIKKIAGAVVTNIILALFLGAIYMLSVSAIPLGFVIALTWRKKGSRLRSLIITGISTVVYTVLKLAVVYYSINNTANYSFAAPVIGREPIIYIVLTLMSVISYVLILRTFSQPGTSEKSASGFFFQFLAIDSIQFVLVFIIYSATTLLLGKF